MFRASESRFDTSMRSPTPPPPPSPLLPPSSIHCILFDLGSTLWRRVDQPTWAALEAEANLRTVAAARALLPVGALPPMTDELFGASLRALIEAAIKHQHHAIPDAEPHFAALTVGALHAMGVARAELALGALVYEALRVRATSSRVLDADALQTLAALRARGYLLGIVTNRHYGGAPFLADLHQMGVLEFIQPEHIAISADLGYRKPHPAIYWRALHGLGVAPAETAMVGDSLIADVYGAQQLGLFTVWKPKPEYRAAVEALRKAHGERDPVRSGETEPGVDASANVLLFEQARQRALAYYPSVSLMATPNAIISSLSDLLPIFRGSGGQ